MSHSEIPVVGAGFSGAVSAALSVSEKFSKPLSENKKLIICRLDPRPMH